MQLLHDEAASVVLHEMYHARKDRAYNGAGRGGLLATPEEEKEFALKELWDKPEYASTYAMANRGEEQGAETFAHTFTPGSLNKFASPDAVRRFESPLGIDMIGELVAWEQRAPGIVDRLMSTNAPGLEAPFYTGWLNPS